VISFVEHNYFQYSESIKGADVMNVIKMNELKGGINQKGILMKILVDHEHATVRNLVLYSKQVIPPHQVLVDVFFYIVEGKGSIQIGEIKMDVEAQDIVLCPPNTLMSIFADKGTTLSFLNVKTPKLT